MLRVGSHTAVMGTPNSKTVEYNQIPLGFSVVVEDGLCRPVQLQQPNTPRVLGCCGRRALLASRCSTSRNPRRFQVAESVLGEVCHPNPMVGGAQPIENGCVLAGAPA